MYKVNKICLLIGALLLLSCSSEIERGEEKDMNKIVSF